MGLVAIQAQKVSPLVAYDILKDQAWLQWESHSGETGCAACNSQSHRLIVRIRHLCNCQRSHFKEDAVVHS